MKSSISTLVVIIVFHFFATSLIGQSASDTLNFHKNSKGSERKGLYIGGGTAIVGGVALGVFTNGIADYPRSGLPIIAGSIGIAPTSLFGLGLGSLLSKKHSSWSKSFQLGIGMAYSSPIFAEYVPGNSHLPGINVRVLSSEIGPWRYSLGFSHFFSKEYEFEEIESYAGYTNLSWWELDLDLQYMIYINDNLKFYPFIGSQYNRVNTPGRNLNTEFLVNYGIGTNFKVLNSLSAYAEMKYTIDPDDNPGRMIFSAGVLYYL